MGTNPTKAADNVYCRYRKAAAMYNDKLNSREGAAELLGISQSTLADYELGITKIIPADSIRSSSSRKWTKRKLQHNNRSRRLNNKPSFINKRINSYSRSNYSFYTS